MPSHQNRHLIGFVACIWLIAFLAVFGLEIRFSIYNQNDNFIPLLLLIIFITTPLVVKRYLLFRLATKPQVYIKDRAEPVTVKYRPAHPAIQTYVKSRAESLLILGTIEVLYLPLTYNTVDAYVLGSAENQTLVLSGGAQSLYLRGDARQIEQFKFLIDHELGHVYGNDTGILYLARAILISVVICLPIKLLLQLGFDSRDLFDFATQIFPRLYDGQNYYSYLTTYDILYNTKTFPGWLIFLVIVLYQAGAFFLSVLFYTEVVRQREYTADQFALRNSLDGDLAGDTLASLVNFSSSKNQPPHAFSGAARWHPSLNQRLQRLGEAINPLLPSNIIVIGFLGVCLTFRFCFGLSLDDPEDINRNVPVLAFISGVFTLFLGFITESVLSEYGQDGNIWAKWKPLFLISFWSLILALFFTSIIYLANDTQPVLDSNGVYELFSIEMYEMIWLYYSLPITVLIYGLVFWVTQAHWKDYADTFRTYMGAIFLGSAVSVLLITLLSAFLNPRMKKIDEKRLSTFESKQLLLGEATSIPGIEKIPGYENTPFNFDPKTNQVVRIVSVTLINQSYQEHTFYPPLSFIALWQGPFKGSMPYDK